MTPTDELRAELSKRGVEYEVDDGKTVRVTRWKAYGEWVSFIEYDTGETRFCTDMRRFTPAQAIAATLGSVTVEKAAERIEVLSGFAREYLHRYGMLMSMAGEDVTDEVLAMERAINEVCGRKVVDA